MKYKYDKLDKDDKKTCLSCEAQGKRKKARYKVNIDILGFNETYLCDSCLNEVLKENEELIED